MRPAAVLLLLALFASALSAQVPEGVKRGHEQRFRETLELIKNETIAKKLESASLLCERAAFIPTSSNKSLEIAFETAVRGILIAEALPADNPRKEYWLNMHTKNMKKWASDLDLTREERDKRIEAIKKELTPVLSAR